MMDRWRNWSGKLEARPDRLVFVRSEDDLVGWVRSVRADGDPGTKRCLRAVGSAHSHSALVPTAGTIVDFCGLAGVVSVDGDLRRARVRAGTPIYALGRPLHDRGLALHNQGDIDRQTIGGAVATGTHGTGEKLRNLSSVVCGARLVLASGEIVECSPETDPELLEAARLHLGGVGFMTELELQLVDAYRLREKGWEEPFESIFERLDELAAATRHFEFFWYPHTDEARCKSIDGTDDEAEFPVAAEGSRVGWSYEVLPNHRPVRHTEMEYSVPAEVGPECFAEVRRLLRRGFPDLMWPVEYRTLAADDVWLSTAYERPTVTLSVHQAVGEDDEPLFRACEAVFRAYAGRPHWGKVHYLAGHELAEIHPRWGDWWRVRDRVDPDGVFLNSTLRRFRDGS